MTQMLKLQKNNLKQTNKQKNTSEGMETLHRMETMGRGDLMENVELKNTEPEMKNSLGTSNSRLGYRRNNCEPEDGSRKCTQIEAQRERIL